MAYRRTTSRILFHETLNGEWRGKIGNFAVATIAASFCNVTGRGLLPHTETSSIKINSPFHEVSFGLDRWAASIGDPLPVTVSQKTVNLVVPWL